MHVHVGPLYPSLLASVAGLGALALYPIPPPTTPMELDCELPLGTGAAGTTRLQKCAMVPKPATPVHANPEVGARLLPHMYTHIVCGVDVLLQLFWRLRSLRGGC